ncbi:MAG: ABC transporter ATP-binding protein [Clostridia bacterium]|nr:ABC transporter ATP-binding protein [Clostridia bacterium]
MEIKNLTACYGDKKVIDNLSINFEDGQISCVLGASGVGKTTLLNCIANLKNYQGEIESKTVSYVFQQPRLIGGITVYKNLELVGISHRDIISGLEKVNLLDKKDCYPHSLSGGEKQRINFLRAISYPSQVVIMDEPFSSLDLKLKLCLISDFLSLWKESKKTVIFVTHDVDEALMLANRVIVMSEQKVALDLKVDAPYPREYLQNEKERKILLSAIL